MSTRDYAPGKKYHGGNIRIKRPLQFKDVTTGDQFGLVGELGDILFVQRGKIVLRLSRAHAAQHIRNIQWFLDNPDAPGISGKVVDGR